MPYLEPSQETLVSQVLSIISKYRRRSPHTLDRVSELASTLEKQIKAFILEGKPVQFIVPIFPFKDSVEGSKQATLGSLLDKADDIALQTLEGLAKSVAEVYSGGASITIVSNASIHGGKSTILKSLLTS